MEVASSGRTFNNHFPAVLDKVRNTFAASLLMPSDAVRALVANLAKGHRSRRRTDIYDENAAVQVSTRSKPESQKLRMHDIVLLAHHFTVSCPAVLYRLASLRLITDDERKALADQHGNGVSRDLRRLFGLPEPDDASERQQFHARFLHLALEPFRHEEVTRRKLVELVRLADAGGGGDLLGILDEVAASLAYEVRT